jgi:hypothetical protein
LVRKTPEGPGRPVGVWVKIVNVLCPKAEAEKARIPD